MALLVPEFMFKNVTHITLLFLYEQGIKGLVLDVDNTLTGHGSQELRPDIAAWLQMLKDANIRVMLASNNYAARVKPFADKLGVECVSFCCKPSPVWLLQAKKRWNLPSKSIALVGDQLFTDYLAGSLYGARVLVVRPLYEDPKLMVRMKRVLEKPFLARYYKKGGKLL